MKFLYLDEDACNGEHGPSCMHSLALCKPCQPLLICPKAQRVKPARHQNVNLGSIQEIISCFISVMAGSSEAFQA